MFKKVILISLLVLLSLPIFAADKRTLDPLDIALGARSLSLGRTYAARLKDPMGVFVNPGNLASLNGRAYNFTATQLLSDVMRYHGGITHALDNDLVIGGGLIYSNERGGIYRDQYNNVRGSEIMFTDAMLIFGIGKQMGFPFSTSRRKPLYVGANLKYFHKSFYGDSRVDGGSKGFNADIGLIYRVNNVLTAGLHGKNVFSTEMDVADSDLTEAALQKSVFGLRYRLLGKQSLIENKDHLVYLSADVESSNEGSLLCYGTEWLPMENVSLRAGYLTSFGASGSNARQIQGSATLGAGFWWENFEFNYSYQPNHVLEEIANHYLTVTIYDPLQFLLQWVLSKPKDKTIAYVDEVTITGFLAQDRGYVLVNGEEVDISTANLRFSLPVSLNYGKNKFIVEYFDDDDELVERKKLRLLRLKRFADIPDNYYVRQTIEEMGTLMVITKPDTELFKPDNTISRRAMLVHLMNLYKMTDIDVEQLVSESQDIVPIDEESLAKTEDIFKEFLKDKRAQQFIVGYPSGYLLPDKYVTRVEGAALFVRFNEYTGKRVSLTTLKSFKDIDLKHWASKSVAQARKMGLIHGTDLNKFEPSREMKRVEMTLMMARTKFIKAKIRDLYDWDSY